MNIIDIIILTVIALHALSGYVRGFVLSFLSLIRIFLSIAIVKLIYTSAIEFLTENTGIYNSLNNFIYPKVIELAKENILFSTSLISDLLSKLVIILFLYFIINIILSIIIRFIDSFFKSPILNRLNKSLGLVFGSAKGILIVFLIYSFLTPVIMLNNQSMLEINTSQSLLAHYFYHPEFLINLLQNNYPFILEFFK